MKKYWVYVHTCPNGKKYVGCTTKVKPEYRWVEGRGYRRQPFEEAIRKYGWDNITHEVFEVDSKEEMYRKEIELISFYHSNDPKFGYNNSIGGEKGGLGCIRSEETRKKLSKAQKKRCNDPEYRKKLSEIRKGKPFSEEHKRHIVEAKKGQPFSEEHKKHLSEARKGKPNPRKGKPQPRIKISLPDGTIIEITKNNLVRNYINKGKEFEYVS